MVSCAATVNTEKTARKKNGNNRRSNLFILHG
jgi:hypothetical protein